MNPPRRKLTAARLRIAQRAIFISLCALAILETTGSLYYRVLKGNSSDQLYDLFRKDPEGDGIGMVTTHKHHPYLLFANGALLKMEHDTKPAPLDTVRIAVTGGSVAHLFTRWDNRTSGFQTQLRREISCLKNRRIEIVDLAAGGYKQPQQLIATTLFIDRADYFLNLDGLNESIGDPLGVRFPTSYPLFMLQFSNRKIEGAAFRWIGSAARQTYMGFLQTAKRNPWLAQSGAYLLTWRLSRPVLIRVFLASQRIVAQMNGKFPTSEPQKKNHAHKKIANWESSLTRQHQILQANQKPHLFYVQPNLHLPERKLLSIEERELKEQRPNWGDVGDTMSQLAARTSALRKHGLPITDLTGLFEQETRTVYSDNIGHLNDTGQAALAGRFASDLKKIISCR